MVHANGHSAAIAMLKAQRRSELYNLALYAARPAWTNEILQRIARIEGTMERLERDAQETPNVAGANGTETDSSDDMAV